MIPEPTIKLIEMPRGTAPYSVFYKEWLPFDETRWRYVGDAFLDVTAPWGFRTRMATAHLRFVITNLVAHGLSRHATFSQMCQWSNERLETPFFALEDMVGVMRKLAVGSRFAPTYEMALINFVNPRNSYMLNSARIFSLEDMRYAPMHGLTNRMMYDVEIAVNEKSGPPTLVSGPLESWIGEFLASVPPAIRPEKEFWLSKRIRHET